MLDPDSRLQVLGPLGNQYTALWDAMLILFGGEDTLCMHALLSDVSGFSACGFLLEEVCGVLLFVENKMHLTPNLSGGRGFIKIFLPFLIFGFLGHLAVDDYQND